MISNHNYNPSSSFFIFFYIFCRKSKLDAERISSDIESKENQPPKTNLNGVSEQVEMVDNVRKSANGHHDKMSNNKEYKKVMERLNNQKAVDKITLDYPELGLADYGSMMSGDQSINRAGPNSNGMGGHGAEPGNLNGLSPLNKSQIISRRLKLDLRNESEIPIAGTKSLMIIILTVLAKISS